MHGHNAQTSSASPGHTATEAAALGARFDQRMAAVRQLAAIDPHARPAIIAALAQVADDAAWAAAMITASRTCLETVTRRAQRR